MCLELFGIFVLRKNIDNTLNAPVIKMLLIVRSLSYTDHKKIIALYRYTETCYWLRNLLRAVVMVVIVWHLDLQLFVQSVPITIKVVKSIPAQVR